MIKLVELPEQALPALLEGSFPPGVYRWSPERPTAAMADALSWAASAGWRGAALELADVRDKATLLDRCAADLEVPEWFGRNWDALADCLTDLSWWQDARGYLLLTSGWPAFQDTTPKDAATAAEILAAAADYWAARDVPLAVLLG